VEEGSLLMMKRKKVGKEDGTRQTERR